ncbi:tryptophan 7-halogenase [Streptomyces sp. M10(2022)]
MSSCSELHVSDEPAPPAGRCRAHAVPVRQCSPVRWPSPRARGIDAACDRGLEGHEQGRAERFGPRNDTPFWRACKELELAEGFKEKVALYESGLGVNLPITNESSYYGNFEAEFRILWSNANYYCVFSGLDLLPDHSMPALAHRPESIATAEASLPRST